MPKQFDKDARAQRVARAALDLSLACLRDEITYAAIAEQARKVAQSMAMHPIVRTAALCSDLDNPQIFPAPSPLRSRR